MTLHFLCLPTSSCTFNERSLQKSLYIQKDFSVILPFLCPVIFFLLSKAQVRLALLYWYEIQSLTFNLH